MTQLLRRARAAGSGKPLDVRWANGAVLAVGALDAAPDDTVLELAGAYLAPGLVDAHVHLSRGTVAPDSAPEPAAGGCSESPPMAAHALATLAAGVTAVRDLGSPEGPPAAGSSDDGGVEVGATGRLGPRVVAAGRALTRSGCYGGFLGLCVADGTELEARAREQVEQGAGTLKVILTGQVDFRTGTVGRMHFDEGELRRVAAVARRAGVPLAVHANGHEGVSLALRVGADSLEHGILLDDEDLRMMAASGTRWVPTLTPLFNLRHDPRWPGLGALYERHSAAVDRGVEMGVTVVAGSDAGSPGVPHPSLFTELALLRRAGFDAEGVGRAAGAAAAALLGMADGYGRLETGAKTDLVWFSGDPYAGDPGPPLGMLRV